MPLQAPDLDNRRYDDLVAEALTRIPRYTPEWTDHNPSDPGITLLQLFAWMTDLMLYRFNQVPERNYIKFLQLLGIELQPAQPAATQLTFTLAQPDQGPITVPGRTQVAASVEGAERPIVFETKESLIALGSSLAAVQVFDGIGYTTETTANDAKGQAYYPFGVYAREGSALLLGFTEPLPEVQINLALWVHQEGDERAEGRACQLDLGDLPRPAVLVWEYWAGRGWLPLTVDEDQTQALARNGHIYFEGPGDGEMAKHSLGNVSEPYHWIRCRLEKSYYETPPRLERVLTNTVRATHTTTIEDEVVGGSTGRPNQSFHLASQPVVEQPAYTVAGAYDRMVTVTHLLLEIDEGSGFQAWQQVDDFYAAGPDAPVFILNPTTGEIQFGDGIHGRIPVANPTNPAANIVARTYRTGGGSVGNVGAETLTTLQGYVPGVDSVTNLRPASGGSDEESLNEARRRAPQQLKSRQRAVTPEDFEYFARQTPGAKIGRARALPLVHPDIPDARVPGVVTVIVVPDHDQPCPTPGPRTLEAVCRCLNQHRLLTSEVHVIPPTYKSVKIEADLVAQPQVDLGQVRQAVEQRLTDFFHPLRGGSGGSGWPFGGTIFYSEVYAQILQTAGVQRIDNNQLVIWLDDQAQPFCRDVPLEEKELLCSKEHEVRVRYDERGQRNR